MIAVGSRVRCMALIESKVLVDDSPVGRVGRVTENNRNLYPYTVVFDGDREENFWPMLAGELALVDSGE